VTEIAIKKELINQHKRATFMIFNREANGETDKTKPNKG
jgi:hypothetical protein